jgi:outer membrane protein TolC
LVLAGCEVGRNYRVPSVSTPEQFAELSPTTSQVAAGDIGSWWRDFHDPELDALIERGLSANMDMQLAASRIRQARYHEREVRAQAFPSVDTNLGATRTQRRHQRRRDAHAAQRQLYLAGRVGPAPVRLDGDVIIGSLLGQLSAAGHSWHLVQHLPIGL